MHALLGGRGGLLVGRLAEVDCRDFIVPDDERLRVASRRISRMAIHAILDHSMVSPQRAIGTSGHESLNILLLDGVPQAAFSGKFHVQSEPAGGVVPPLYLEVKIHPLVHIRHDIVDDHLLIDIPAPAENEIDTHECEMNIVTAVVMLELPHHVLHRPRAISLHGRHEIRKLHAKAVCAAVARMVGGASWPPEAEFAAREIAADIRWVIQSHLVRDGPFRVVGATLHHVTSVLGHGESWFDARNPNSEGACRRVSGAYAAIVVVSVKSRHCGDGRCQCRECYGRNDLNRFHCGCWVVVNHLCPCEWIA